MTDTRKNKLALLDKAFNQGDISGVAEKTKGHGTVLYLRHDAGLQRQEVATIGNQVTIWNYSDDEAETIRQQLLTKHNFVIVVGFDN
jgi:hypothetical protein